MNDIPAPKPDTVSIYLNDIKRDADELHVTQVTVNAEGALLWIDPIGHIQIGEDVLSKLLQGVADRPAPPLRLLGGRS